MPINTDLSPPPPWEPQKFICVGGRVSLVFIVLFLGVKLGEDLDKKETRGLKNSKTRGCDCGWTGKVSKFGKVLSTHFF